MVNYEEIIVEVEVDTQQVQRAEISLGGLKKTVQGLKQALCDTFDMTGVSGYIREAVKNTGLLDKQLLVLRLSLGKLKSAIGQAVAPIAAVLLPIVQQAVYALARLARNVGAVIGALFGGAQATKAMADSQKKMAGTSAKASRALASFDEVERLKSTGGTGVSGEETVSMPQVQDTLSPKLQAVVDKINSLIEPLRQIDLSAATDAFSRLGEALSPLTGQLFAGLEWAYHNLFVPLAAWTVEDLLPAFLELLAAALGVLNEVLIALQPLGTWLWENFLQPIAQWTGETIIEALQWLTEKLEGVSGWISENQPLVEDIAIAIGSVAAAFGLVNGAVALWNGISVVAGAVTGAFGAAVAFLTSPITLVVAAIAALIAIVVLLVKNWDTVKETAVRTWEAIKDAFGAAGTWFQEKVLDPLVGGFKDMVNGIIGFLNSMISGIVGGINGVIDLLNKLSFDIPDWIPGIGGETFGFNLKTLATPQIPYLAQGAVLPANKPFMAVVGDQKHGTNVEAPLETIKQALSEVMAMQGSGDVNIRFTGDLAQLARVLKPQIDRENRRVGAGMVRSVTG